MNPAFLDVIFSPVDSASFWLRDHFAAILIGLVVIVVVAVAVIVRLRKRKK